MMRSFLLASLVCTAVAAPVEVTGKAFDRFISIWLENQDFSKVSVNSDIASLAQQGILLTEYYGLTHPSQPNYIASIGGDYFGLDSDDFIRIPQNVSTLVDLFDTQGITWSGFFEGIPGPGYMGAGSTGGDGGWDYVRKHNPFIPFDSINTNGSRLSNILSFRDFEQAVKAKNLPQYSHMSPNMLNDGHNTSLEFSATWSERFLTPLLTNDYLMNNTLILLTYDESETYSLPNRIVSILLGGAIPQELRGTTDDTFYTHYSILSTIENNWDLPNLGRYDVGANVFKLVADQTDYRNMLYNISTVDLSISYPGFLSRSSYAPIPPPNLQLVGAGGQSVLPIVASEWQSTSREATPYDGSGKVYDAHSPPVYKSGTARKLPT